MAKTLRWIFLGICILSILFLLGYEDHCYSGEDAKLLNEKAEDFGEQWRYTDKLDQVQYLDAPVRIEWEKDTCLTLTKVLPSNIEAYTYLCFKSFDQQASVTIDGIQRFSVGEDSSKYKGDSAGQFWNFVLLSPEDAGKEISIYLISDYAELSGKVSGIMIGTKTAIISDIVNSNILGFVLSFILCIIGVVLVLMHVFFSNPWIKNKGLFYLGAFVITVAIWTGIQTSMLQLFTDIQVIYTRGDAFLVMLMPIAMIAYMDTAYVTHKKKKIIVNCLYWVFVINLILSATLYFWDIVDLYTWEKVTHVLIGLAGVLLISSLVRESVKYKNQSAMNALAPMLIMVVTVALEIYDFYFNDQDATGQFLRFGVFVYALLVGVQSIFRMNRVMEANKLTQYYERLAYSDVLTGGNNRTAYYREIDRIFRENEQNRMWLILFDMNNLKRINDVYGHVEGDRAIKIAAKSITAAFEEYGKCFRIGGDEFAVLALCDDKDKVLDALETFERYITEAGKELTYRLSIAVGFDQFGQDGKEDFEVLYSRVDGNMYKRKKEMKEHQIKQS